MKIISLYPNFANQGGAQDVLMQIAVYLNSNSELPIVLTDTPLKKIDSHYKDKADFRKFNPFQIIKSADANTVIISHDRRYTTILCLLSRFFYHKKFNIIHIAHNLFFDKRFLSFYPKHIIAVSNAVKNNLVNYYNIPEKNVQVIYNGIKDSWNGHVKNFSDDMIKIILPGRINSVKQQVDIVKKLKGKLNNNIEITFAGVGNEQNQLIDAIEDDNHFKYIGHVNLKDTIPIYDYVMLFSKKEGLPLSLIEGCMFSKPLITNRLEPVLEVNQEDVNGFVFDTFEELVRGLNTLSNPSSEKYQKLSNASRSIYEEKFTDNIMLENYQKYINKLLQESK